MKKLIENESYRVLFKEKNQALRERLGAENICRQWEMVIANAMKR